MWILIGVLVVVVFGNIIFAIMFCVVLSKIVTVDAQSTTSWQEFCTTCSNRLALVSGLLAYFEHYTITDEDKPFISQLKIMIDKVTNLQANAESYLDPDKSEKFEDGQAQFGDMILKLIQTMDSYAFLSKKPEYITARSTLNTCESRLDDKVAHHNALAQKCNKLISSFPGPVVATMMRFSAKAVITKKLTKVNERISAAPPPQKGGTEQQKVQT